MSCGCSRPVPVCFCDRTSTRRASESHMASAAPGASAGRCPKPGGLSASPNGIGSPVRICGECSPSRSGARSESGVPIEPWIPLNCRPTGGLCWRDDHLPSCACRRCNICENSPSSNFFNSHTIDGTRATFVKSDKNVRSLTCCPVDLALCSGLGLALCDLCRC